jgi:uncharacterized protein YfaS (alpha-2-macroglobulin family)
MKLPRLLLIMLLAFAPIIAAAQGFDLPGLSQESGAYQQSLQRRFPAGGTPQQRAAAERRAQDATARRDFAVAATAWEERIGLGNSNADHWLALAEAQLARTPPENNRALQAAWRAFQFAPGGEPEVAPLLLIAEALRRQDRLAQQVEALEAVTERLPHDARHKSALDAARRAAGMLVRRVNPEPDAEPARACITFTIPPARRGDWRAEDWVRADPALPNLTIEREGDQLCVGGLPWGETTRLILRAGLPGEGGNLRADTPVAVAMPEREARIMFENRAFILPRGQAPRLGLATINIEKLQLRLIRLSERNLISLRERWRPGEALDQWMAQYIGDQSGRVLWEGSAALQGTAQNRLTRQALPLADLLRDAAPGLYVLSARQGETRRGEGAAAAFPFFVTDIALTAWRGADGLAVQARSFQSGQVKSGLRVALMARNNDVLAEARTDASGLARFPVALLRGQGSLAPFALHAEAPDDLAALNLEAASFDLSDRGASGRAHPGPLDAFLWLDRGIYRPGETVNLTGLLRDAAGNPQDVPVRLRLRRPNGQIAAEITPPRLMGGAISWPLRLSDGAVYGQWNIEALADPALPPIGRAQFRVDAFVPEGLEVTAGPAPGPLVPGATALNLPISARFLYGAPGAGLTGNAEIRLLPDPEPFETWRGWRFGLLDESFAPDLIRQEIAALDREGRGVVALSLPRAPDTTLPIKANVTLAIAEPGGRESRARLAVPVRAAGLFPVLRPAFQGDAIDAGAEAAFDIAAVAPDGNAAPARLRLRLLRERPDWRLVMRDSIARFETVWRDEPVDAAELTINPAAPTRFARSLPFGRYRLEIADADGLGMASYRFRAGWAGVESAEIPDRIDVAAERRNFAPGEVARLRITPPFAGPATIAVLTDRLMSLREVTLSEAGTDIEVPVDAAWGPGAYITVTAYRPGEAREGRPGRALGLAWIGLDPAPRRLEVAITAPERIRPRQRVDIPIRIANGRGEAMVTLAAVDEGILRLTGFASPDPVTHFLGKRALGVDIRDDYGRLLAPAEGALALLRQGGDGGLAGMGIQPPQKLVSLFSGPVRVNADGTAMIALDIPDFAGELRLMAVAWEGTRIGAASRAMTVRDQAVGEAALPRFLAPGDTARLPVLLHNIELPPGEIIAELSTEGGIEIEGPSRLTAQLATGERAAPATTLRARAGGEGILRLRLSGPEGFSITRESRITIRPARPVLTDVQSAELPGGAEREVAPAFDRFVPGSARAELSLGAVVRYDAAAALRAVEAFPLACLEQSAARAIALSAGLFTPAGGDHAARLQAAVQAVLDRQRFDGAFGLWSANAEAELWLTPFAVEALLRARAAGATLPEAALNDALRFLDDAVGDTGEATPEERAAQAYRLHALAMAGRVRLGAARRLMESAGDMPTPLSLAQLGAVFARGGDRARAEQAFNAALSNLGRRWWRFDLGTAQRDALAVASLLKESGLLADRLAALMGALPGQNFTPENTSTQEQAWAVLAAVRLGQGMRPIEASLDGVALPPAPVIVAPLAGPARLRNLGSTTVWQMTATAGIPREAQPAARQGLRVTRHFHALDGSALNLDTIRAGDGFILILEARADVDDRHQLLLQQGLPAGWEITGRFGAGEVSGLPWLGQLTAIDSQPALDDRFIAAVTLEGEGRVARIAVRLRAVTAGSFELPGAEARDMYRPAFFARQNTRRIGVLP